MSLINDALKRARHTQTPGTPPSQPPLQPVATPPSVTSHLLPAVVVFLMIAAIFTIGWAMARHFVRNTTNPVTTVNPVTTAQPVKPATKPVAATSPLPQAPPVSAEPLNKPVPAPSPVLPRLQGIFYSPTTPTAIVDGKTLHPGDHFQQYQVKAITKNTVILSGSDGKQIQLSMGN